jgi:hypothetical protein
VIRRALGARSAILQFIPALIVFAALWPVARPADGVGDTFQFWYAGHLLVTGASPYDQSAWHAASALYGPVADNVARNCADPDALVCVWAYPPLTAWLFAPFGALPVSAGLLALNTFVLLVSIAGATAAALYFGPREPPRRALLMAVIAAGHPFTVGIAAGHFVGLLLLAVVAVAYGLRERRGWLIAAGALALALKPHVVVVLGLAVAAVLATRGAWRTIATIVAVLAVAVGAALARSPESVDAILARGGAKTGIAWSTTWALAGATGAPIVVLLVIFAVAAAAATLAIRAAAPEHRDATIVAVAAAMSLVVAPYAQPYDFMLAVPAVALVMAAASASSAPMRSTLLGLLVVVWVGGTWGPIVFGEPLSRVAPTLVPVASLGLLAAARPGRSS